MSSKAQKRKELVIDSTVEPDEGPTVASRVLSAVRSALALFSAHRAKVAAAAGVAVLGVLAMTGVLGVSNWASSLQPAPERTEATATAAPAAQSASEAALAAAPAAAAVASKPELSTCFTPGENCMSKIVKAIDGAKSEILVQAYSFSAKPLINALGRAHARGVKVRVILDKADERERDRAGSRLIAQRILPHVDTGVASAHNKVIVVDRDTVITGSFNFTDAAQKKNAENVLLIKGHPDVAAAYAKNWERRMAASRPYYGTMAPVL
ncbi:MAG: phospholipase D family protein [Alphaproteobacteria bacterium]|nr:phospholipase D family protein [Alphaproteobacteria bacterium]